MMDACVNLEPGDTVDTARNYKTHVDYMLLVGSTPESNRLCKTCTNALDDTYYTVGIHPYFAQRLSDSVLMDMADTLTTDPKCVALGECGLDYKSMYTSRAVQKRVLDKQLSLAASLDKPVILHERDRPNKPLGSQKDLFQLLDKHKIPPSKVLVHCYTSNNPDHLRAYVARGYLIGVSGFVCMQQSDNNLATLITQGYLPLSQMVIETDTPFLSPLPDSGGHDNTPANLHLVAEKVATCLQTTVDAVVTKTTHNMFRWMNSVV